MWFMANSSTIDSAQALYNEALVPIHVSEAERLLGIGRSTLEAEIRAGRLSACRVRGRLYLTRAQIATWLKRIEVPARDS